MRCTFGHNLVVLAMSTVAGCAVVEWIADDTQGVGQDFDIAAANQIRDGVTTKAEVQKTFGNPGTTQSSGQGESWTYVYERVAAGGQKTFGSGTSQKTYRTETTTRYKKVLTVTFDAKGIVVQHFVSESGTRGGGL